MPHPWKDLIVWQKSHLLVLEIYRITDSFPKKERFVLIQQIRRSAVSISSNIVEGKSRKTDKEFVPFLHNSRGSLEETCYHLLLARDLNYISTDKYNEQESTATEVSFLLNKLIGSILS